MSSRIELSQGGNGNVVQGKITRMDTATKERLEEVTFNHVKRGLRGDITLNYPKWNYKDDQAELFLDVGDDTERGNSSILHLGKVRVDIRKVSLLDFFFNAEACFPGKLEDLGGVRANRWVKCCKKQICLWKSIRIGSYYYFLKFNCGKQLYSESFCMSLREHKDAVF